MKRGRKKEARPRGKGRDEREEKALVSVNPCDVLTTREAKALLGYLRAIVAWGEASEALYSALRRDNEKEVEAAVSEWLRANEEVLAWEEAEEESAETSQGASTRTLH